MTRPRARSSRPTAPSTDSSSTEPSRKVGRPRSTSADQAILDAALALLAEVGVGGLTMSGVVERSGVARATVYRRYPTREAMTAAALARVKGREPFRLSGDVEQDIATGVHQAAAVLASAEFRRFLPLFVAEAMRNPASARAQMERVAPNHGHVAREYGEIADAAGLRTDIDPTIVADIVQGAMLMRLLATGRPPSKQAQADLVAILRRGLKAEAIEEADEAGAA
jgi:AcrR family transcriptional regulator